MERTCLRKSGSGKLSPHERHKTFLRLLLVSDGNYILITLTPCPALTLIRILRKKKAEGGNFSKSNDPLSFDTLLIPYSIQPHTLVPTGSKLLLRLLDGWSVVCGAGGWGGVL